MKPPRNKEEYLVWPPMAVLAVLVVAPTLMDTVRVLHSYIPTVYGTSVEAVYLFSIGMGAGLSLRLHGKYWLGFGWLAFLCYVLVQGIRFMPESSAQQYSFVLSASMAIMFVVLSAVLYAKRVTIHAGRDR